MSICTELELELSGQADGQHTIDFLIPEQPAEIDQGDGTVPVILNFTGWIGMQGNHQSRGDRLSGMVSADPGAAAVLGKARSGFFLVINRSRRFEQ